MGHTQPLTPIKTDNTTALGVGTTNIQPQHTKIMDMHFCRLRCREAQEHFRLLWRPVLKKWMDYYFTNHHSLIHHKNMIPGVFWCQQQYYECWCNNLAKNLNYSKLARGCARVPPEPGTKPQSHVGTGECMTLNASAKEQLDDADSNPHQMEVSIYYKPEWRRK